MSEDAAVAPKLRRVRLARILRANANIGLAAAAVVFLVTGLLDLLSPSNPLRDPVSELALDWAGPVVSAAFVVAGLAILALAVALSDAVRSRWPSWWQTTLLALGGTGVILLGLFPTDPTLVPSTVAGKLHAAASALGFLCLSWGVWVASRRMRGDSEWYRASRQLEPLAWIALALFVATAAALGYAALTQAASRGLVGGIERLLIADLLAWALLACLHLHRVVPVAR